MQIMMSDREVEILREALTSYLPELRREVARTEAKDYRHALVEREELLESLLRRLEPADG
jgi:hypothetical protein